MDSELRFYTSRADRVAGPFGDDDLRDGLRDGRVPADTRVRLVGTDLWTPITAWATFGARRSLPHLTAPAPGDVRAALPRDLAEAPPELADLLLFAVAEDGKVSGPVTGEQLRRAWGEGRYRRAAAMLVDGDAWYEAGLLCRDAAPGSVAMVRCPTCLETIAAVAVTCPECGEATAIATPPSTQRPGSIPDDRPDDSWLVMHWRPLVTIGFIWSLLCTGIALRHLAPDRWNLPRASSRASTPTAACTPGCWNGESCQLGACVWQPPNDVGHVGAVAAPIVAGPFSLPKDLSDALPLDGERFAVASLAGVQIHNARTGEALSLASDAPQSRALYRVGDVVYATAPQRIYVLDAATTRLIKTIEVGSSVGAVTVGASGRRVLASLPTAHSVAVIASEYHAEIDRIQFGDDPVGPVGTDDSGKRALTTTGHVPLPGLRDPTGGAVYAFDPSRLASAQDRVRASVTGNPVSVLMTPDGAASWVVARADHSIVPLSWLPSGAVRQAPRIATCREPEQILLLRKDRRALVRCNEGRALEVFDLATAKLLKHVPLGSRAVDMAVTPDGKEALVALPNDGQGSVGVVDLDSYEVTVVPLGAEPSRIRLAPDGTAALVVSDRSKVAWVLR